MKKVKWEKQLCNICQSKRYSVFIDNIKTWEYEFSFRIVECVDCGLKYLNPRPQKKHIGKFYSPKFYWGIDLLEKKAGTKNVKKISKDYSSIYRLLKKKVRIGKILDIGVGTGSFLLRLKEMGWSVEGVELSGLASKYAKEKFGISIKTKDFLKLSYKKNSFDAVTFNSSLEHLHLPLETLSKSYSILKSGGYLIITVPNIDSLGFLIFNKHWLGLHPPKHLYHFNKDVLGETLKKIGFEIIKISHWHWNHSYYSFFQSARYYLSPKYRKRTKYLLQNEQEALIGNQKNPFSYIFISVGKILVAIIASLMSIIGALIKKGEAITIYAKKG